MSKFYFFKLSNICFLLGLFFFISCKKYTGKLQEVKRGDFSISLPDFMQETDDLHAKAVLQYSSKYRSFYAIVLRDEKNTDFATYQQAAINILKNYTAYKDVSVVDSVFYEGKRLKFTEIELYGRMSKQPVYYTHRTYETERYYYQVCVWTRGADHKLRYYNTIQDVLNTFKPVLGS